MHKIKKVVLPLCFIVLLSFVINITANIFERKGSTERYAKFWENPKEYDVWFMGTSHVYYAIQPMELWNRYGIRSYNLAAPSSHMPQVYWTMMCALQYSRPEVIVLDTYKVDLDKKYQENEGLIHTGIDSIPLSAMKVKGICDIFDTWEKRFEYICKFSVYHNRWEELTEDDFHLDAFLPTNGGLTKNRVVDNSGFQNIAKEDMSDTNTLNFLYLEKIIEECQNQGIKLILTELPFCSTEEQQRAMNAVPKVAEKYGLPCLNIAYEEGLLDYGVDFGDEAHVNIFGSEKLTGYIGNYLSEHCNLRDYRKSAEVSKRWNDDYGSYLQWRLDKMRKAKKIKSYVQWLKDDRYTCYMYRKKEPGGLLKKEIARLDNIIYISLAEAKKRMGGEIKGEYAFFVENDKGEVLDKAVFKNERRK